MSELYLGVMSGTSFDGIDMALCEINMQRCTLVYYKEYSFDEVLRSRVQRLYDKVSLEELGALHRALGIMYANAINRFVREVRVKQSKIAAVGLHGQTVWHAPEEENGFSLQIGDANSVAAMCGMRCVADVRGADIARGGQGAPLAPAFHRFYFQELPKPFGVLNLGGIANLTVILDDATIGFDVGPANALMDSNIAYHKGVPYDKEGAWAKEGNVDEELLELCLQDPYFAKESPKSTGKEYFGRHFIDAKLRAYGKAVAPVDLQRTLVELTARSIADAANRHKLTTLLVAGGGAKNSLLLKRLSALCEASVEVCKEADALEAMMMAWLAFMRIHKRRVDLSTVTGSSQSVILGALYEP